MASLIPTPPPRFVLQVDPKDSFLFDLAIESGADVLTTYNSRHILSVREPDHPQNDELRNVAAKLRLLHPKELARDLVANP